MKITHRVVCLDHAEIGDVADLCTLEAAAFPGDAYAAERLQSRQFRHLIRHGHAQLPVMRGRDGKLLGYAAILYRQGSSSARLYSLAVQPDAQGGGLGSMLLAWAEELAIQHHCQRMALEALAANTTLIRFYQSCGYTLGRTLPAYYNGQQDGLRLDKPLRPAHSS